jgi:hypothetical protein
VDRRISRVYEVAYDSIVAQALIATMSVVLVCLVLYVRAREGVSAIRAVVVATWGSDCST